MRHTVSERRKRWFFARSLFKAFWEHFDRRCRQRRARSLSRPLFAEALEPRVLYSASPVPVESEPEAPVEEAPVAQVAEMVEADTSVESGPTNLQLTAGIIEENRSYTNSIGRFSATSSDPKSLRYSLVEGEGDRDNGSFSILENALFFNTVADFETQPQYSIRVQVVDRTGNSVQGIFLIDVLEVPEPVTTTEVRVDGSGNLTITDTSGVPKNDNLVLKLDGGNFNISDTGNGVNQSVATGSVTGDIVINGGDGDDTLTIDLSGGTMPRNIVFHGGAGGTDTLVVTGGTFGTVTYNATNAFDGVLDFGDFTVTFTGLEPIILNGSTITDLVVNVDPGNLVSGTVTTTISQDAVMTDTLISFTHALESVLIRGLTGTLTINGDNVDGDIINVTGVGTAFSGSLAINGMGGTDTVNVTGDISFATNSSFSVTSETVTFGAGANVVLSGTGAATVTASRNVSFASGSSLETVDGSLTVEANQQLVTSTGNFRLPFKFAGPIPA